MPKNTLDKLRAVAHRKNLSAQELSEALQQLYVRQPNGDKTLLVPSRDRVSKVTIHETPDDKFAADAKHFPPLPPSTKRKPNINGAFLRQLRAIFFRVAMPSLLSKEAFVVVAHSFFLVMRTYLSVLVAKLDGAIVRDLIRGDGKGFLKGLGLWFLLAVPSTYTNSMLRHLQSKLSMRLRTNLTRYLHDLYLSSSPNLRYYRSGLEGVDQYLTSDVESWADSLAGLYGNVLKPSLDLVLFTGQLAKSLGLRGTLLLFGNYYATVTILRAVTPAFGRLAAIESRLEGEYRAGMGRVGREAEEIAFYNGGAREKTILMNAYLRLIKHVNSIFKIRIAYEFTEDFVIKYLWSAAGYVLIAVPLLFTRTKRVLGQKRDHGVADRTETYISNRRLLLSLADAGGRLMYAYKDLLELAGLTTRLYTLISTLLNLPPLPATPSDAADTLELSRVDAGIPLTIARDPISIDAEDLAGVTAADADAPPLVKDLSFLLKEGEHLMITGANGVGKTAVARVLAGLWAPQGAEASVRRPARGAEGRPPVFVVPQRAYMVAGSLLDQIIYPHSYPEFLESGKTEADLMEILEMVFLAYLPEREGGWQTRKEWRDILSGGEKQRMSLARAFYHRPKFAILDECTSAVSSDVEGRMYEYAKGLGITLITISLRPSLMKYHTKLLTLAGDASGRWTLSQIGTAEERMGIEKEIAALEEKLEQTGAWEARLKELDGLLSQQEAM
ncbi:ABC transporter transmembrane region 2-domain-containing protein [Schizophyllum amplum]|uniref:ABC transporter transmembrane region 2-domain-containing protein n=1 Tax=Schizophyllum amplum TaxID=97359 RepID=A0A550CS47_9AGAR|nr:ABC transporter transmembrane region 2-domain-containing protein [Auriculariopsis ampla]